MRLIICRRLRRGVEMNKLGIATVIVGVLITSTAMSQPMHSYTNVGGSNQYMVFLDTKSLQKKGNLVSAWTLWVANPTGPDKGQGAYQMSHDLYDCAEELSSTDVYVTYDGSGQVISSQSFQGKLSPVVPDTIGENALSAVCKVGHIRGPAFTDRDSAVASAQTFMRQQSASSNDAPTTSKKPANGQQ